MNISSVNTLHQNNFFSRFTHYPNYDCFICYSPQDDAIFPVDLAAELKTFGHSVHLDSSEKTHQSRLDLLTKHRLRNSQHLLVIAGSYALSASTRLLSIIDYHTSKNPSVPIVIDRDNAIDDLAGLSFLEHPHTQLLSTILEEQWIRIPDLHSPMPASTATISGRLNRIMNKSPCK